MVRSFRFIADSIGAFAWGFGMVLSAVGVALLKVSDELFNIVRDED